MIYTDKTSECCNSGKTNQDFFGFTLFLSSLNEVPRGQISVFLFMESGGEQFLVWRTAGSYEIKDLSLEGSSPQCSQTFRKTT